MEGQITTDRSPYIGKNFQGIREMIVKSHRVDKNH